MTPSPFQFTKAHRQTDLTRDWTRNTTINHFNSAKSIEGTMNPNALLLTEVVSILFQLQLLKWVNVVKKKG